LNPWQRDPDRDVLKTFWLSATGLAAARLAPFAQAAETAPAPLTRKIPSSGEPLPVIGLGTWQTFDVDRSQPARAPLAEVLGTFVELGGKLVDSSPMYGNSEEVVGDLAAKLGLQKKLFIATKVWSSARQEGITQMEDSMRKLGADPIDLMQVHNLVDINTHLSTLREWKQAGRVRYIGVTHYTASGHDAVARIVATQPLDFLQINYSVAEREAERRLLPLARERAVAVIANRPFAAGGLFGRLRGRPLPSWAAEIACESWAQILLKFILSNPAITCAIPATSKVAHLRDNMKAAYGPLPDEKLHARIAAEVI
jgi:diketogulonate reductase-like aldo/keto reductase